MILSIDVGKGTEDVLIIDPNAEGPIENAIQLVIPSTAQLLTNRLQTASGDWFFKGYIMGGEPWNRLVYEHADANRVVMTADAAMSLRYDPDQVTSHGIEIAELPPESVTIFHTRDINFNRIEAMLHGSDIAIEEIEYVLLACQDHGRPDDRKRSTRDFRMKTIYNQLDQRGRLEDLLLRSDHIPSYLPRHQAIASSVLDQFDHLNSDQVFVMDSSPAVIAGAVTTGRQIIINAGNGHTLVMFLNDGIVETVYETHTGGVTQEKILKNIKLLLKNELSHEQSLQQGGHGVYARIIHGEYELDDYLPILVIGPNRSLFKNGELFTYVHPMGNMMMAGPLGLVRSFQELNL